MARHAAAYARKPTANPCLRPVDRRRRHSRRSGVLRSHDHPGCAQSNRPADRRHLRHPHPQNQPESIQGMPAKADENQREIHKTGDRIGLS